MKEKNVKKCKLTGGGGNSKSIKKTLPVILLLLLITIVIGVTYAAYLVTLQSGENSITTGLVSMSYTESTNVISIDNALPISDAEGKASSNYFDFSVTSNLTLNENDPNTNVYYSIEIEPLTRSAGYYVVDNPTEEQMRNCTTGILAAEGITEETDNYDSYYSLFYPICSGGDVDGTTMQSLVDSVNSGEDNFLDLINVAASTGIVEYKESSVDEGYNALKDNEIKLYLEDLTNNKVLIDSKLISNLSHHKLYSTNHLHKYNLNNITTKYRLRAWIDYDVDSSTWDATNKYEYKFRVNVNSDVSSLDINTLNNEIIKQVKTTNISYKYVSNANVSLYELIDNPTTEQINSCKTYFIENQGIYTTDTIGDFCSGGADGDGYTMQYALDNDYFSSDQLESLGEIGLLEATVYNNGDNGVFLYNGTDDNGGSEPIYYYRGDVENNYVLFANKCWKIVRTTSTGGTKLIYNGVPDENGTCTNSLNSSEKSSRDSLGSESDMIGYSEFNTNYDSPAYVGYMYGTVYTYSSKSPSGTIVYGNDVTYSNGIYTLKDTKTSTSWSNDNETLANKYHYTCFTSETTCSSVYYITYFGYSDAAYYLTFTGGDTLDSAKTKMYTNTNNSTIKTTIDNWYSSNLTSYTNYLENTIFCNDRSSASGTLGGALASKDTGSSNYYSTFAGYERTFVTYSPSLQCSNINDRFSLRTDSGGTNGYGNNKLTYPVGLLTYDEVVLAGATGNSSGVKSTRASGGSATNYNYYLYNGDWYWLLSPGDWGSGWAGVGHVTSDGGLDWFGVDSSGGARPVVSLQPGTQIIRGTGEASSPYVITEYVR